MVNATQRTQMRITELGSRVMDNAQMTSELQLTLRDYQVLSERQYRLLQTHVIRLNNSLQDLQDDVSDLVHNVSAPPFFPLPWFTTSVLHLSSLFPGSQRQCSAFLPGSQRQCSTFLPLALVHNVSAPPFFPWPCTRCHAVGRSWDLTALFIVTVLQVQSEFSH